MQGIVITPLMILVFIYLPFGAKLGACDLHGSGKGIFRADGAGAHGGDRLQSDILRAQKQAAHVLASVRTSTLNRATEDAGLRTWIMANKEELQSTIARAQIEFNDDVRQEHCALVLDREIEEGKFLIHFSRPRCQNITSIPKAGELIIHEAVHLMGIESESFAPAVAYVLYLAWEYAGHALDQRLHSIAAENAPAGRESHTSVWTGSEFIVWGGFTRNGETNLGSRYDHVTDEWRATSDQSMLIPRFSHSAVWSGKEMIVWGGARSAGMLGRTTAQLNDGAAYSPQTNSWRSLSMNGKLSPRFHHAAVWAGKEMIIWGGVRQAGLTRSRDEYEFFADGSAYNPETDSWRSLSMKGAPTGRFGHTMIWTGPETNQLIVWGGQSVFPDGSSGLSDQGGILDLNTDKWTPMAMQNAPSARSAHTAVWTGSKMIVWGGITYGPNGVVKASSGGIFDPKTNNWQRISDTNAPAARDGHIAVWTGSHMLIYGGKNPMAVEPEELIGQTDTYGVIGLYEPVKNEWTTPLFKDAWMDRRFPTGAWTGHEFIVWGGLGQRRSGRVYFP